ncbi:MAG: right-handed parallel beta-helix repeat-containing protein [Bryobacteraceae bacterium]|nr:right-handed parallel beta-helix repeat-containing protein [Bryobacteraceae bacterium]
MSIGGNRNLSVLAFLVALPASAQNAISSLQFLPDAPTVASIGARITYLGDDNRNAAVGWRFRAAGESAWRPALPMLRVRTDTVPSLALARQFAGSIFDLRPGTNHQLEATVLDPDGGGATLAISIATRETPRANPASARPISVSDVAGLTNALNTARAGDVITLQPGTYNVQSLPMGASGAAGNPIFIRGASQTGVILDGGGCAACNILEIYGSYVTIESLTLRNAFQGLRFLGAGAQGNVLRRVILRNVLYGVNGRNDQRDFYYGDNVLEGRLAFPLAYDTDSGANADSYGFALYGAGHVVAHNLISGFANCIAIRQRGARALDIYGNDITYAYDDAIELDGSQGNVRVFRNRITNSYTGISVQPVLGGPAYIMRNTGYNIKYEQVKFHSHAVNPPEHPSGVLVYHNTFLSPTRALRMESPLPNYNSVLMNNLFLGPPAPLNGQTADWAAPLNDVAFDYNGYYPDGKFYFNTSLAAALVNSLASVFTAFGFEQHGRLLNAGTLASGINGPPEFATRRTPQDPVLSANSLAADAAAHLPNINEGYSGAAPDLGALERGCPIPTYGPRPAGNDETNLSLACSAPPAPPVATPDIASVSIGGRTASSRLITTTVTHPAGVQNITAVSLRIGAGTGDANTCAIDADPGAATFYLWNDAGSARLGPAGIGSASSLANSRCSVSARSMKLEPLAAGAQLQWQLKVTFAASYRERKTVFARAGASTGSSGWKSMAAVD